ncbi:MAG: CPBP family intramembrane metalloprotease [Clostridia bacterium]|nr:CPBP family intramembrane metalloprotease [Clostridia bacterium]
MNEEKKTVFRADLIYFVIICIFVGIRIMSAFNLFSIFGSFANYIFSIIVQIGLLFLFPLFLFSKLEKRKVKDTLSYFGFKKISLKAILISICIGVLVYILNVYIANFFHSIIRIFGYNTSSSSLPEKYPFYLFILNIIFTAVLPGICEEVTHRGMLLKANGKLGMKKAILISGLLFGLLHLNIEQFFYASVIGVFFGYVAYMTNSIYPTIIFHFLNNGIGVFMGYATVKGWKISNFFNFIPSYFSSNIMLAFFFLMIFITLLVLLTIWLTKALIKETLNSDVKIAKRQIYNDSLRQIYLSEVERSKLEFINGKVDDNFDQVYGLEGKIEDILSKNIPDTLKSNSESLVKPNFTTKLLLVSSFVLMIIITIFTFIWGIL